MASKLFAHLSGGSSTDKITSEVVAMEHLTELKIGCVSVFGVRVTLHCIHAPALERLTLY